MSSLTAFWTVMPTIRRAILLVVLSTIGFAASHILIRYVSANVPALEISFFHNFFGLALLLPWLLMRGISQMRTQHFGLHFLRSVLNASAMMCFFSALPMIPIAKVTALFFTSPIFAALLSTLILGEAMHARRWSAMIFGFIGTLVILRPGLEAIDLGSVLVLAASLLWAGAVVVIRVLGRTEDSFTTTAYMSLGMAVLAAVPAGIVWQTPSTESWLLMVVIASLGTGSMLAMTQALRLAEASALVPFDFLKLLWVSILAYIFFDQGIDVFTWGGGAIVFGSTIYLAYRENQVSQAQAKAAKLRSVEPRQ